MMTAAPDGRVRNDSFAFVAEHSKRSDPSGVIVVAFVALSLFGYLVPRSDYRISDLPVIFGLNVAGLILVWAVGGKHRAAMMDVYARFLILAVIVFIMATWYASLFGTRDTNWLMNRYEVTDDETVYQTFVIPSVGVSNLSLREGLTNAPLHWLANVRVQEAIMALSGRPWPCAGNLLSMIAGAVAAACMFGAFIISSPSSTPSTTALVRRLLFVCPWLLAVSAIAIRDSWVYLIFAMAVLFGLRVREAKGWFVPLVAVGTAGLGVVCFFLRVEMVVPLVALFMLCANLRRDDARTARSSGERYGARLSRLVAAVALLAVAVIAVRLTRDQSDESPQWRLRAVTYARLSVNSGDSETNHDRGTVVGFVGDNLLLRGAIETLWLPFQPLPKVQINPGSLYVLGKILMPIWIIALVVIGIRISSRRRATLHIVRRWALLLLWCAGVTVAVGFTSAETRHFFVIIPVLFLVVGSAITDGPSDAGELLAATRIGATVASLVFLGSVIFTGLVFGGVKAVLPWR